MNDRGSREMVTSSGLQQRRGSGRSTDAAILAAIAALSVAAFANGLGGAFVYDDLDQIVGNELIRGGKHFWKAVFSDVWAFQGNRDQPWISYWRPTFVLWWMLNYRLFGVGSAFGWHATSLLLHVGVGFLGYGLLRRLRVQRPVAAAIMIVFAVHPVHVESVTWISGSMDLLAALGMVGALWCELSAGRQGGWRRRTIAGLLFAFGILAKEFCIVFPFIVLTALLVLDRERLSRQARILSAVRRAAPYAAVVVVYLVVRLLVLGRMIQHYPWQTGPFAAMATLPSMLVFYIRQAFIPYWIGPSYQLRPVTIENIGAANFVIPLIGAAALGFLLLRLCRGDPVRQLGLAIFVLTLLPTMNASAFIPEQLVHDRYLYIPLLGLLMIVVPALAAWLERTLVGREGRAGAVLLVIAGGVCLLLTVQTVRYSAVWKSEMSLWEGSIRSDPFSAFNYSRYAVALHAVGRGKEAALAAARAIELSPKMTYPYLMRAQIAVEENRFDDAEKDLYLLLSWFDDNPAVYELLAQCFERQGNLTEAADVLRRARLKVPYRRARFTDLLATVLHSAGRKDEALTELESVRGIADQEYGPGGRMVLFHLGMLYDELGRDSEAKQALTQYLASTEGFHDQQTEAARRMATGRLAELSSK